ncbi:MAG: zinc-binding dehydrogenase [Tuberibacillus sp.]
MKAVVFHPDKVKPVYENWPKPSIGAGDVIIRVHAASLNHRDLHITNPVNVNKFIYGSDGAGVVEQIGASVTEWNIGDEVIINPQISCLQCSACLAGDHALCEQGAVLGGSAWNGTFSEFVKVPSKNLMKKPEHLDFEQAAALPLALGTAWRSLVTRAQITPGETVLIQGIGGGVALFCLQIAVSMGARAIVTSHSEEKLTKALEMGAYAGINYIREDVPSRVMELTDGRGADIVISSSGKALPEGISAARPKGRIVHYAYIGEDLHSFNIDTLMDKQLSLYGSAMHSYSDFEKAIHYINQIKLVPIISDVIPIKNIEAAFETMRLAHQFGKIVISFPD